LEERLIAAGAAALAGGRGLALAVERAARAGFAAALGLGGPRLRGLDLGQLGVQLLLRGHLLVAHGPGRALEDDHAVVVVELAVAFLLPDDLAVLVELGVG